MDIEKVKLMFLTSEPVTIESQGDHSKMTISDDTQKQWINKLIGAAVASMIIAASISMPQKAHANECVANAPENIANTVADSVRVVDEDGNVQPRALLNIGMAALTGGASLAIQAGTSVAGDCVVDDMRQREARGEIEAGSADSVDNALQIQREGAPGLFNRVRNALESNSSSDSENRRQNRSHSLVPDNASLNDVDLLVPASDQRSKFEIG